MKRMRFFLAVAASTIFPTSFLVSANPDSSQLLIRDQRFLWQENVNLTGDKFLQAWGSTSNEQERLKADMYLMGVLDATEGKNWCNYQRLKTITLQEIIYSYFKKPPQARLNERAAKLIEEAITQHHSCKRE
ncbi:Rap1a/Tai family immunity protein [Gibbsiella quercinecans]|uniref:Rap1a/Tai family immunity protein n=1 Tax=Gibbsiella quercinecans TaxID=929813 RepID=UPI003A4D20B5